MFYSSKARFDPGDPRRVGKCERCDAVWNFEDLAYQLRYMGPQLQSTGHLVCPDCLDEPAPFERTIIIPADPPPSYNARQVNFPVDSVTEWTIQPPPGQPMFAGWGKLLRYSDTISGWLQGHVSVLCCDGRHGV